MFDSFLSITYPPIPITKIGPIFFGINLMYKAFNLYTGKIKPLNYFVFSNTYLAVIFISIVADVFWTLRNI